MHICRASECIEIGKYSGKSMWLSHFLLVEKTIATFELQLLLANKNWWDPQSSPCQFWGHIAAHWPYSENSQCGKTNNFSTWATTLKLVKQTALFQHRCLQKTTFSTLQSYSVDLSALWWSQCSQVRCPSTTGSLWFNTALSSPLQLVGIAPNPRRVNQMLKRIIQVHEALQRSRPLGQCCSARYYPHIVPIFHVSSEPAGLCISLFLLSLAFQVDVRVSFVQDRTPHAFLHRSRRHKLSLECPLHAPAVPTSPQGRSMAYGENIFRQLQILGTVVISKPMQDRVPSIPLRLLGTKNACS